MSVSDWQSVIVEELEAETTNCDCCGETTTSLQGDLLVNTDRIGFYYVNFTRAHPEQAPEFRIGTGNWSETARKSDRWVFSALYHPSIQGFEVQDLSGDAEAVNATYLKREDIIGRPFVNEAFALLDAIFMKESRLEFLRA